MVILCILDGFGISNDTKANAVYLAKKPNLNKIFEKYNMVLGKASGEAVGLPEGQMGNSEVGHLNIGSGRIVYQDILRIRNQIKNRQFFSNEALLKAIKHAKENKSNIHIMGLLSNGGVHSHIEHLFALLQMMKENNFYDVYIDIITDGRDTATDSGINFIKELQNKMTEIGVGTISTVAGRYYAMDRDKNYDRIKKAYDSMTNADIYKEDVLSYMKESYDNDITDEFIIPMSICTNENANKSRIKDNDSVIFFNFRPDRARQITRAFVDTDFNFFVRKKINNVCFVCFTDYDNSINEKIVAFEKEDINDTLGEVVSKHNLKQLRIAETEKYAHVTFFFNGGREEPFPNEDRILINSPKSVATYDLKPEMSAREVLKRLLEEIDKKIYDLIVVNFANPDMVGHTGSLKASIEAVEVVDDCVGKIYEKIEGTENYMFICADHGNCEKMLSEDNKPFTAHTTNPVPFVLVNDKGLKLKENGSLCDIAPTILKLMNIEKPIAMTGKILID